MKPASQRNARRSFSVPISITESARPAPAGFYRRAHEPGLATQRPVQAALVETEFVFDVNWSN